MLGAQPHAREPEQLTPEVKDEVGGADAVLVREAPLQLRRRTVPDQHGRGVLGARVLEREVRLGVKQTRDVGLPPVAQIDHLTDRDEPAGEGLALFQQRSLALFQQRPLKLVGREYPRAPPGRIVEIGRHPVGRVGVGVVDLGPADQAID